MRLWFFSSGDAVSNADADARLMAQLNQQMGSRRRDARVTFVPANPEDAHYYFEEFGDRMRQHDIYQVDLLDIHDVKLTKKRVSAALRSDLIYLSGGNTFHLLHAMRATGFERDLMRYVKGEGLLAGHSAGAIVMTPSIATASFPEEDRDENIFGITDLKAMRLVPFEIFPHYRGGVLYNVALQRSSMRMGRPIYALPDGSAIAVDGDAVTFVGPVWGFVKGVRFKLT